MDSHLIHRVNPVYTEIARNARTSGSVRLHVIVESDGRVRNVRPLDGHPLLTQSAMDAMRQWRYTPYTLDGEPVEVEFPVTFRFSVADR
jgi:periplasmic protein TonB